MGNSGASTWVGRTVIEAIEFKWNTLRPGPINGLVSDFLDTGELL